MKGNNVPVLLRQYPTQIIVVATDLCESETMIKQLSSEVKQAVPRCFSGESACVFFKLQYVAPCERFNELRRLILEIQSKTGLRAHFKGIVALEVSEWVNHERENYFSIILKYLFDHRDLWQPVLILKDCAQNQLQRFLSACAIYMTPRVVDQCFFSSEDRLEEVIRKTFSEKGHTLRRDARKMLTVCLLSNEYAKARSLTLIDRVADELIAFSDYRKEIGEAQVRKYLQESYSTLSLLAGKTFIKEKEHHDEHESLYL